MIRIGYRCESGIAIFAWGSREITLTLPLNAISAHFTNENYSE